MNNKGKYDFEYAFNKFDEMNFVLLETKYINANTKMKCYCKNHPDIIQYKSLYQLNCGRGCKYCSYQKRRKYRKLNIQIISNEFNERDYDLLDTEYKNCETHLNYICRKHPDKIQKITYSNFHNGYGCRFCGNEKIRIFKSHDLEFAQKVFRDAGYIPLFDKYNGVFERLKYMCPKHPESDLSMSLDNMLHGKGCPICARERNGDFHRLDGEFVRQEFIKRGYTPLFKANEYVNNMISLPYRCNKHPNRVQYIRYSNLQQGKGCALCSTSNGEIRIEEVLLYYNISYKPQRIFDDCIYIEPLRFDLSFVS